MKRIVWRKPDGSIAVTTPGEPMLPGETEEAYLDRIALRTISATPSFAGFIRLGEITHRPSRRFREAWDWSEQAKQIHVDPVKARSQVLAEVRIERDQRLLETDSEKNRLDDSGTAQEKQALKAKRQALREMPAKVELEIASMTAEELERYTAKWPD